MKKTSEVSINRRIKQVRETLKLSQVQFSRVISLSGGYLAGVETEKRKVNERLVKLICSSFNVNTDWLKTGEGPIFIEQSDEELTKLVSLFRELDPQFRGYILKQIGLLLEIQDRAALKKAGSPKTTQSGFTGETPQ